MKKRLRDRLEVRQKAMEDQQRAELQDILTTCKNKTAMRIREALLLHKQMLAMEQFRWGNECCLMPNEQATVSWCEQVTFWWDDYDVLFVLDQHA